MPLACARWRPASSERTPQLPARACLLQSIIAVRADPLSTFSLLSKLSCCSSAAPPAKAVKLPRQAFCQPPQLTQQRVAIVFESAPPMTKSLFMLTHFSLACAVLCFAAALSPPLLVMAHPEHLSPSARGLSQLTVDCESCHCLGFLVCHLSKWQSPCSLQGGSPLRPLLRRSPSKAISPLEF